MYLNRLRFANNCVYLASTQFQ